MCLFLTKCIENAEGAFSCRCNTSEVAQSHYVILFKTQKASITSNNCNGLADQRKECLILR